METSTIINKYRILAGEKNNRMDKKVNEKENWKLGKAYIADNSQGGIFRVAVDTPMDMPILITQVNQVESWVENERVKRKTRKGYIEGALEDMLCMTWEPKSTCAGKVVVYEQTNPPVEEEPELFLAYKGNKIRKYCGKPVYRLEVYVFKTNTPDVLLPDD